MRQILEICFPVLVTFYLIDGLQWGGTPDCFFVSHFGEKMRLLGRGLHLPLLVPSSRIFEGCASGPYLSADGLYIRRHRKFNGGLPCKESDFNFLPYYKVVGARVSGRNIHLDGGGLTIKSSSCAVASLLANDIRAMIACPAASRKLLAEELEAKKYDTAAVRAFWQDHGKGLGILSVNGSMLFGLLFLALPAKLFLSPDSTAVLHLDHLLLSIAVLALGCFVSALVLHWRLYPGAHRRFATFFFSMLCSPMSILHASGHLSRNLFIGIAPLTLAVEFADRDTVEKIAGHVLAEAVVAQKYGNSTDWLQFWRQREYNIHILLQSVSIESVQITGKKIRRDEGAAAYCPVCQSEFVAGVRTCPDCEVFLDQYDTGGSPAGGSEDHTE